MTIIIYYHMFNIEKIIDIMVVFNINYWLLCIVIKLTSLWFEINLELVINLFLFISSCSPNCKA